MASALLAGAPNIDALFSRPANETQMFNLWTTSSVSDTFRLRYHGSAYTGLLSGNSTAQEIEAALEGLAGLDDVVVEGSGTSRDPWRVKIVEGAKDSRGGYFLLETDRPDVLSPPSDAADAAATTRPSISLTTPASYQRVYYDFSAENVEVRGGGGDDVIISDDGIAAMKVYGDAGDDSFIVGRVLDTVLVNVDTNGDGTNDTLMEVVNGADGITNGVTFNSDFYGGAGKDYFEVNHNVGALRLFGESGDDTFFLKAQLTTDPAQGTGGANSELARGEIVAGAGDDQGQIDEADKDVLINYVQNNRVEIFGGSGFDTVVVAGTALADTFYIFTDNDGRQYLFGAGLKLENIDGVERLAVMTGGGNDTVYLYGLKSDLSLVLGLGSGDDQLIVGGEQKNFNVVYPASSAVYTVGQKVLEDQFWYDKTIYNDVVFQKHEWSLPEKQAAFQEFYTRWISSGNSSATEADAKGQAVLIDDYHWNLLEANLTIALKLFTQGIEKSDKAAVYNAWLWPDFRGGIGWSDYYEYINNANALEAKLLEGNEQAFKNFSYQKIGENWFFSLFGLGDWFPIFGTQAGAALRNGTFPEMPDQIDFKLLAGLAPASGFYGNGQLQNRFVVGGGAGTKLDQIFYEQYLRPMLADVLWGDFIRGEQVRLGTGLNSPRIANWGYEPDFYGADLVYNSEVPWSGGNMPHVTGESGVWTTEAFRDQPNVGTRMFWDLIGLFYDAAAPKDVPINYEKYYRAALVDGTAAYRFDHMPERSVTKILPENYDLERIAGVVRLAGGAGDDTVTVNARSESTVTVESRTIHMAEYEFDFNTLPSLPQGILPEDVADALRRADTETDIGVIGRLQNGTQPAGTDVQISIEQAVAGQTYTLASYLDALEPLTVQLKTALPEDIFADTLQRFVAKGNRLLDPSAPNSTAAFSLDALDALLNDAMLRGMVEGGPHQALAVQVDSALKNLRGYLTLASVDASLRGAGYNWTDSALTVYQQNTPNLAGRTTVKMYSQNIWDEERLRHANEWASDPAGGNYANKLGDPQDPGSLPVASDGPDKRLLQEIKFTVNGVTYHVGGSTDPQLAGNEIALNNEYVSDLDNLDTSYYTYYNYGVGADGDRILESVTIRRLNDSESGGAQVAGKQALDGGMYLTKARWISYVETLENLGVINDAQATGLNLLADDFTESNVATLITTAFNQTRRTDVRAPLADGVRIVKNGQEHSVDIETLRDTAGFYLPTKVVLSKTLLQTVHIDADFVLPGAQDENDVSFDTVSGLNQYGLWFSGFESEVLNVNVGTLLDADVDVVSTHNLATLTVNTGHGFDLVTVEGTGAVTTVNTGEGNDMILVGDLAAGSLAGLAANLTINAGADDDLIEIADSTDTTPFDVQIRVRGDAGGDTVVVHAGAQLSTPVFVTEGAGDGTLGVDFLYVYGGPSTDHVRLNAVGDDATVEIGGSAGAVHYTSALERLIVDTLGGDDVVTLDDNRADTEVYLGAGRDTITIGTVATTLDSRGIPVVDFDHTTPGVTSRAQVFGGTGNDEFEINYNKAEIWLYGESGDDTFIVNTFLVSKVPNETEAQKKAKMPKARELIGGLGANKYDVKTKDTPQNTAELYDYLQSANVNIDGGPGIDTIVINGTPIGDVFVVAKNYIAGAGRFLNFENIERVEVNGAGGDDEIYILSTAAELDVTVRGGTGDDTIHMGGDQAPILRDPPQFDFTPDPILRVDTRAIYQNFNVGQSAPIAYTYENQVPVQFSHIEGNTAWYWWFPKSWGDIQGSAVLGSNGSPATVRDDRYVLLRNAGLGGAPYHIQPIQTVAGYQGFTFDSNPGAAAQDLVSFVNNGGVSLVTKNDEFYAWGPGAWNAKTYGFARSTGVYRVAAYSYHNVNDFYYQNYITTQPPKLTVDPQAYYIDQGRVDNLAADGGLFKGKLRVDGGAGDGDRFVVHNENGTQNSGSLELLYEVQLAYNGEPLFIGGDQTYDDEHLRHEMMVSGAVAAGDVWLMRIGASEYSYTALDGDTTQSVAEALRDAINVASGPYNAELDLTGADPLLLVKADASPGRLEIALLTTNGVEREPATRSVLQDGVGSQHVVDTLGVLRGFGQITTGLADYYGVEFENFETTDLRLSGAADQLIIDMDGALASAVTDVGRIEIALGGGDDNVSVLSSSGDLLLLGGAGSDTVTVGDATHDAGDLGGELDFRGDAHRYETKVAVLDQNGQPILIDVAQITPEGKILQTEMKITRANLDATFGAGNWKRTDGLAFADSQYTFADAALFNGAVQTEIDPTTGLLRKSLGKLVYIDPYLESVDPTATNFQTLVQHGRQQFTSNGTDRVTIGSNGVARRLVNGQWVIDTGDFYRPATVMDEPLHQPLSALLTVPNLLLDRVMERVVENYVEAFSGGGTDRLFVHNEAQDAPTAGNLAKSVQTSFDGTQYTRSALELGAAADISFSRVELADITLGDGGDTFTIESTDSGATVLHTGVGMDVVNVLTTSGQVTINAGDDDDTITVHNAGNSLNQIGALLNVRGDGGSDVLTLVDTGDTLANTGEITSTTITGLGMGAGVSYTGLELIELSLGSGGDSLTVRSGVVTPIEPLLDLDLGLGADTLSVFDLDEANGVSAELTATTLRGLGMERGIDYASAETLNLTLGFGSDELIVHDTNGYLTNLFLAGGGDRLRIEGAHGTTNVRGGSGNDILRVGESATGEATVLDGEIFLDGEDGSDIYFVNVTESGTAIITVDDSGGVEADQLTVFGTDGDDTFWFRKDGLGTGFIDYFAEGSGLEHGFRPLVVDELMNSLDDSAVTDDLTRPVIQGVSDAHVTHRQRIYYTRVDTVEVRAGDGDDMFIMDDTAQSVDVYGDAGSDAFIVGRVVDLRANGKVNVALGDITNGVSFNTRFFGGVGDDYFEVNRNVGKIEMFGDYGDDVFFLKAYQADGGGLTKQNKLDNIKLGGGTKTGAKAAKEKDTLVDAGGYVENNEAAIDGGGGFDTVILAGTPGDDTFYIFVDENANGEKVQRIYGAGLKLQDVRGVERFLLLTGAGDDTVYVYGLMEGSQLFINTGSGNDTVQFGGEAKTFMISQPSSRITETYKGLGFVEHVTIDVGTEVDYVYTMKYVYDYRTFNTWRFLMQKDFGYYAADYDYDRYFQFMSLWSGQFQQSGTYDETLANPTFVRNRLNSFLSNLSGPSWSWWSFSGLWEPQKLQAFRTSNAAAATFTADLLALLYDKRQVQTAQYDLVKTVDEGEVQVAFSAEIPALVNMPFTMRANYDLSEIRGHVRLFGAGDSDHLIVNSRATNGPAAEGALRTLDIESADFEFNETRLDPLFLTGGNGQSNVDSMAIAEAVANAIKLRAQTEPGLLDSLLANPGSEVSISLAAGQSLKNFRVDADAQVYAGSGVNTAQWQADMLNSAFAAYLAAFGYTRDDAITVTYRQHQSFFGGVYNSTWLEDSDTEVLQKVDFYGANAERPILTLNAQLYGLYAYVNNIYASWFGWQQVSNAGFTVDNARIILNNFWRLDPGREKVFSDQSSLAWSQDGLRIYEKDIAGDPTDYQITYSYGTQANYENGNLQSVKIDGPDAGTEPDETVLPGNVQARLSSLGIDHGYYFTYTQHTRNEAGERVPYKVLVYRADPGQDVATLEATITSLGTTPFTEANVDAYVKATYHLKLSELKPFTPGIEKQIYSTTVNGAVQRIEVVKSYQGATSGTQGTLNAVQVFSMVDIDLDVPATFVKRLLESTTTTYDAIQGFGLNPNAELAQQAIYYRNFEEVTLNLGDFGETVHVESFTSGVHDVNLNTGGGDDMINVGQPAAGMLRSVDHVSAKLWIDMGAGAADALNVLDDADTMGNLDGLLDGATLTGLGLQRGITYGNVDTLNIRLGSGNDAFEIANTTTLTNLYGNMGADTVTITGTGAGTTTNVYAGDDDDQLYVRGTAAGSTTLVDGGAGNDYFLVSRDGSVDGILGEVTVDAGAGEYNRLVIDDSADGDADNNVVIEAGSVKGLATGDIFFKAIGGFFRSAYDAFVDGISVFAGRNQDNIRVNSSRNGTTVEVTGIYAGEGNDTVTVADPSARYLVVHGQLGDDTIIATGATVAGITAFGDEGDDQLFGAGGNDVLVGGLGGDTIEGGAGADIIAGDQVTFLRDPFYNVQRITGLADDEDGVDTLTTSEGADVILGGGRGDKITATSDGSIIVGDAGVVVFADGSADEWDVFATGGAGGDEVDDDIRSGADAIVLGGAGKDLITLGGGSNTVVGDGGKVFRSGPGLVTRVEAAGAGARDEITSSGGTNIILGGLGADLIDAAAGSNVVLGDDGYANFGFDGSWDIASDLESGGDADEITGGSNNIILGGAGGDLISLGSGNNTVLGDNGTVRRTGGAFADIRRVETTDTSPATGARDVITTTGGTNVILGGVGNDKITAALGDANNVIVGDNGFANFDFDGSWDIASDAASGGDADEITGGANSIIIGGAAGDIISLGGGSNTVLGDDGIVRRAGATTITRVETAGTSGARDEITSTGGSNIILGGLGDDLITAQEGESDNVILGDDGFANFGFGGSWDIETSDPSLGGDDTILGGTNNTILGGAGLDTITLGGGSNTVVGDEGAVRRSNATTITRVETTGNTGATDTITSTGGSNIILGGAGGDAITAELGESNNVILGDSGFANFGFNGSWDIETSNPEVAGDDTIKGGTNNTILGGAGEDSITLKGGFNTVVGDEGAVRRAGGGSTTSRAWRPAARPARRTPSPAPAAPTSSSAARAATRSPPSWARATTSSWATAASPTSARSAASWDIETSNPEVAGDDTIKGGTNNTILGGAGLDTITLGGGFNTVVGDEGAVRRTGGTFADITRVETSGTAGAKDTITSTGGTNIILGGAGGDDDHRRAGREQQRHPGRQRLRQLRLQRLVGHRDQQPRSGRQRHHQGRHQQHDPGRRGRGWHHAQGRLQHGGGRRGRGAPHRRHVRRHHARGDQRHGRREGHHHQHRRQQHHPRRRGQR